ncbi:RluA family pseudouridine synthase [Flavobacteriaceae bacterium F08102]|nr:RluA family pseudouridine synthase [Flavobacteriaceae bacterium F08102]
MGARTKSALKKALKKKYITVNDVIATTATFLYGGECICLTIPKENKQYKKVQLELTVLFEDDYLAIIHKPAGILVSGNSFKTIANGLSQNLQQSSLPDVTIPQPVHRLDFPTTGALMVGKTSGSIRALNNLFATNHIEKTYYAVTIGDMEAHGEIISEIDGKKAQVTYWRIESISSKRFGQLNLVKLMPKTGRRHQLRIQLSEIGNPILGDKTYGKEKLVLMGKGLYLHAYSLRFTHPFTHELCDVKDPFPLRFEKLFPERVSAILAAED